MDRWETFLQQVHELLKTRRLGALVFARCVWQSATPTTQLLPKLARLLETLALWMQQAPDSIRLSHTPDNRDITLVVEFKPSATAVISHIGLPAASSASAPTSAGTMVHTQPLGLDLFLLGTQGAVYLDGTQADWPHQPLIVPDLPQQHPVYQQMARIWPAS